MDRPNDQCPTRLHTIGELLPPDKEDGYARGHLFFVFLFHFPRFHHFTANVTRALPLEAIKGKAGAMSTRDREKERRKTTKQEQLELISIETTHHHHSQETGDLLILSKACNPY
jgi:hypothetical protein